MSRNLWQRFVDASFPEEPECEIRKLLRARLLERTPKHRLTKANAAPVQPVEQRWVPATWNGATYADREILEALDIDYIDVTDGWGNVVDRFLVQPQLARPYVKPPVD